MIEFEDVHKRFGDKQVLSGLTFAVRPGEVCFLLGRSGVGKSVTLKLLVGLMKPDSGHIRVDARSLDGFTEEDLFEIRRRCGMVFQFPALLDSLTVLDNVAMGLRAHRLVPESGVRAEVLRLLHLVRLDESVLDKVPAELSFGLQKRVSIARTLAIRPKHLLFDEPTTSLDPVAAQVVHDLIRHLARELDCTALVISHDMEGALTTADRILVLEDGHVVDQGTPEQICQSANELTQAFLRHQLIG